LYSLKLKGDYQLQLTRTVNTPGRHSAELYLFIPPDSHFSAKTLPEELFFFGSISHRFGLMELQPGERSNKTDESYTLLSPYFELTTGSWLFRYKASMGRLRQQLQNAETPADPISRALRLSQAFAQRLREIEPQHRRQKRYFRQMDIYFSWFAEQFFLECMNLENYVALEEELRQNIADFLQQEQQHRAEQDYGHEFRGTPSSLWNRMSVYNRLLEYPASLRATTVELGAATRKLVKAGSTMVVMLILTYVLFNTRNASQTLSVTLLFGIALIYAVRDIVREDMINVITQRLRKGKPRWRVRLQIPYVWKQVAQQLIWMDYRRLPELPSRIADNVMRSGKSDDAQVICYRSVLRTDKGILEEDEIRENITLDFETICELISVSRDRLFAYPKEDDPNEAIQVHTIEQQQDYNLLVISRQADQDHSKAQLWRLRLNRGGVVHYKSRDVRWPSPEEQTKQNWRNSIIASYKKLFRRK